MIKLEHDGIAQEADMFQVWDRLAEHFKRKWITDFMVPSEEQVNDVLSGLLAQDMVQWEDDGA